MSETTPDQEQQQLPQQGQPRHYQSKQNGNRSQFHKSNSNIQGSRPQPQKHYQTQRSYQGKGHNKNGRNQRNDYGSLQNIPPYMQYYPSPVANGFPNPGPGGFYSYSPTPYYPPATMGYDGSIQPTIMNPKFKVGQENSESSAASSATTTPAAKKIEITNKSGDHVDLNAIHLAQHATEATPSTTAGGAVATFTEGSVSLGEEKKTDENTKKAQLDFLAEVKRRKEMLAKKKAVDDNEDAVSEDTLDTQPKESAVSVPSEDVSMDSSSEFPPSAVDSTDDIAASTPAPLATAEKAESIPAQEEVSLSEAVVDEVEELSTNSVEQTEDIVDISQDTVESIDDTQKDSNAVVNAQNKEVVATEPVESEQVLTYTEKLKLKKAKEVSETPVPEPPIEASVTVDESEVPVDIALSNIAETVSDKSSVTKVKKSDVPEEGKQVKAEEEPVAAATTENSQATAVGENQQESEETEEVDDGRMTMSELLTKLESLPAVEDIYSFCYPDTVESPSDRFKKNTIKYTYPPEFLLQFGDKVNVKLDAKWRDTVFTKIVIPSGSGKSKSKGGDRFQGSNFKKSGSMRMGDRSNSKSMSKRSKSKRMGDDGKSNRSYTSRKEREAKQEAEAEKQKEEVAPLVPSANRWVPKSKMKKTEKKLAPDGVTELLEKEEAERKMKSLLNKLTLEKFDTISEEIISIANQSKWEENGETLKVVIEQIFHKATDEPHWSSMYAQLCGKVVKDLDKDIKDKDNEGKIGPILVLHYLFDRCQTEFQKGWADKLPIGEDGTTIEIELMSDEYYKAAAAKRRGLGLVRLIGFLYRSNLLTSKMMFQCFRRLMKDLTGNPSEETLESVIELLNTVGEQFERDSLTTPNGSTLEGSALLDQLFVMLDQVIDDSEIPSRIKFSLLDLKDMRTASWNGGKRDEGPKTIAQIHEEEAAKKAAEERERRMKGSSRSASRRQNNSMGGRSSSRRDAPPASKDDFITMRSASSRFSQQQKQQKEEAPTPQASSNMFSALIGHDDEDDDEEDDD